MARRRYYPPSILRYERATPTISARISRHLYDRLRALREQSGESVGDVLGETIGTQAGSTGNAYTRGYRKGWRDADERPRADYRCSQCGGKMSINSDKEKQEAAINQLYDSSRLGPFLMCVMSNAIRWIARMATSICRTSPPRMPNSRRSPGQDTSTSASPSSN